MATPKRNRKRLSKQVRNERQAVARQADAARRRRRTTFISVLLVVIIGVFGVLSATGGGGKNKSARTTPTAAPGQVACPKEDGSSPRRVFFESEPRRCIDATRSYTASFETTAGTFVAELFPTKAFRAVNNFVFLARYHFYDGLAFHRALKDTFVQTGEPVAKGVTGPGYFFRDDGLPLSSAEYVPGALLFAHERPNENGSQILVVSGPGGASFDPVFPLFGKVTHGMDVINRINAGASGDANTPAQRFAVIGIEVREFQPS